MGIQHPHVLADSLGNEIRNPKFEERLAEALGKFQADNGFMLEGRLWVGTAIVWFQRAPGPDGRDFGNRETHPDESHLIDIAKAPDQAIPDVGQDG